jgi:ethanolamine kinase
VLLQLNACGFGAPVLATFTNGRVEAWLYARPLEPSELAEPGISRRCAQVVAAFHEKAHIAGETPSVTLWTLIRDWLNTAKGLVLEPPERNAVLKQARLTRIAIA